MCIFLFFDNQQVKATFEKFIKILLDRIKQSCTFATAIGWESVVSGNGDTLRRQRFSHLIKGKSGKAAKR